MELQAFLHQTQPQEWTKTGRREIEDEDDGDGEPNAAELRRRRLRKLETTNTPDHWWRDPFKSWIDFWQ